VYDSTHGNHATSRRMSVREAAWNAHQLSLTLIILCFW
jgi:hypothetical protein